MVRSSHLEVRVELLPCLLQPVDDFVALPVNLDLQHSLLVMEANLTNLHSVGLLQVVPRRVNDVHVVDLAA